MCRMIAKADVLAQLLKARVGLPLLYPLNSRGLSNPLSPSAIASNKWKKEEVILGLSQVAPLALALSRVGGLLRAARALNALGPVGAPSRGSPQAAGRKLYRDANHFLRPQVWRVLKPGEERATKHLRWR